jgi:hypothetical protein
MNRQYQIAFAYGGVLSSFVLGFGIGSENLLAIPPLVVLIVVLSVFIVPPTMTALAIYVDE